MNSRFAVAVHILTLVEGGQGSPVPSDTIAASVNTNPSLVRRLLGQLTRAGLTTSRLGAGGGTMLARGADRITLGDVYRAVDAGEVFALHREMPNPACPVGRNIQTLLTSEIEKATLALELALDRTTIADIAAGVRACESANR